MWSVPCILGLREGNVHQSYKHHRMLGLRLLRRYLMGSIGRDLLASLLDCEFRLHSDSWCTYIRKDFVTQKLRVRGDSNKPVDSKSAVMYETRHHHELLPVILCRDDSSNMSSVSVKIPRIAVRGFWILVFLVGVPCSISQCQLSHGLLVCCKP
jgi:hypothetical protein